jgi:hypothetical protein
MFTTEATPPSATTSDSAALWKTVFPSVLRHLLYIDALLAELCLSLRP